MINGTHQEIDSQLRERSMMQYIDAIHLVFVADEDAPLFTSDAYQRPLFASMSCVPATSAPVEGVDLFSENGLTTRPRTAKMSDTLLESLVFLKCNATVYSLYSSL
jgi:hypothetical protein